MFLPPCSYFGVLICEYALQHSLTYLCMFLHESLPFKYSVIQGVDML